MKILEKILNVSETLKILVFLANSFCRFALTATVKTTSNECSFIKLKIIKNQLRTRITIAAIINWMTSRF